MKKKIQKTVRVYIVKLGSISIYLTTETFLDRLTKRALKPKFL